MEKLALNLKQARKKSKMTQEEVAKIINRTRETYCRYEIGTLKPDLETLSILADLFQTSTDWLLGRYKDHIINSFKDGIKKGEEIGDKIKNKNKKKE